VSIRHPVLTDPVHDARVAGPTSEDERDGQPLRAAELTVAVLGSLLPILRAHTATADRCFFGQWEGWGYLDRPTRIWTFTDTAAHARIPAVRPDFDVLVAVDGSLELRGDRYRVFTGLLEAAELLGNWPTEHRFEPHSPDLIWPVDKSWCVATEVDDDRTLIAGSPELAGDLVRADALDAELVRLPT
jgi:hypothetical protein